MAFNTAILLAECYNATVNINNNTINQSAVQSLQNGVGIQVSLAAPSSMTMNIFNNTITRVRTGIWLFQLTGPSNVFVKGNNVKFYKPNSFYQSAVHYGLRLEGCITVKVDSNKVVKIGAAPNLQMLQQLRGISVENSPGSLVINNYFEKCGSGVFAIDFCFGSTIACDTFTRCYNGVLFAINSITGQPCFIGDQVFDPNGVAAQTGCVWNATLQQNNGDVAGAVLSPIFWRHGGVPPNIGANNVFPQLVGYSACQTFYQLPPPPIERELRIEQSIVAGADSLLPVESKHWYNKYAYRQLNQNTSLITLNLPNDTLYQNFYANHNASNTRLIRGIEYAAQLGDTVMINDSCSSLQCSNTIEHNIKTVYRIYSNSYLPHGGTLTNGDSTVLVSIALADPAIEGPAVYTARAMLNLEQHYFSGNPQRTAQSGLTDNVIPAATVDVFPNPADDAISIVLNTQESSGNVTVKLIDLSGREVLSESHPESNGKISLNVSSVEAGTYLLSIFRNGANVSCQPIVVSH
jgi:hypothetical protein